MAASEFYEVRACDPSIKNHVQLRKDKKPFFQSK